MEFGQKKIDAPHSLINIESYDPISKVFVGSHPGSNNAYLAGMWLADPLIGISEGQLLTIQASLSTVFPVGAVVQIALMSTPDAEEAIYNYLGRKGVTSNPLINELSRRHADLMLSGVHEPLIKSSGVHFSKKRLILSFKYPVDSINDMKLKEFNEHATKIQSGFASAGLNLQRANVHEYLKIVRLLTHVYDTPDSRYDPETALSDQVYYRGDEIIVKKDHLVFNTGSSTDKNFVAMALSPKFFPKESSIAVMNYALGDPRGVTNQITDPYFALITMHYSDQVEKRAAIQRKSGWIKHQMFGGSAGKWVPALAHKNQGFEVLNNEIETNSAILVDMSFCIWHFGKTREVVARCIEEGRTYMASLGFDMRADKLILDALFTQHMPMGMTAEGMEGLFRTHTLTASQSCQFLPILSEWKGTQGKSILLSTRRGEVGGIDLYESDTNFNAVIVAAPGAGKSFLTQRIISDYLAEGAKVWVIDSGRSYQKLAAAVGGTFMEFSPESNICLNPFTSFLAERGGASKSIDDEMEFLASLLERMAAQREQLNDLEVETLKRAIRSAFIEYQGHTTIENIAAWLQAQTDDIRSQELALRLNSFAYGQYAKTFNGYSNVNMNNDFVVLELDDLKSQKQLQQVVLLQLISQITHEMYLTEGRKKILIIDEAWSLLDDPIMAKAMEIAFRTARKYGGAVVVVTHGIADLYKSRHSQAMIENAAWQFILQQKAEAIDDVVEQGLLRIEPYFHQMLKTVNTVKGSHSEVFISRGNVYGIFRLTVDRFTQVMFSTDGKERTQIMEDIQAGRDVIESIQSFVVGENAINKLDEVKFMIQELLNDGVSRSEVQRVLQRTLKAAEVDAGF
jgi:conjugal transfer ATP-binding protein TraC